MNWVDFVIIGVIAISIIVSFFRGFLREALSLLIWVVAIWMAVMFYPDIEPLIPQDWGLPSTVRMALAGAAILLGVLIVGGIITWALGSFLDKTGMSGTDRIIGILFGGLRGVVLIAIAIIVIGLVPAIAENNYWKQSQLIPHFQPLADWGKQKWDESGLQGTLNGYIDGIAGETVAPSTDKGESIDLSKPVEVPGDKSTEIQLEAEKPELPENKTPDASIEIPIETVPTTTDGQ